MATAHAARAAASWNASRSSTAATASTAGNIKFQLTGAGLGSLRHQRITVGLDGRGGWCDLLHLLGVGLHLWCFDSLRRAYHAAFQVGTHRQFRIRSNVCRHVRSGINLPRGGYVENTRMSWIKRLFKSDAWLDNICKDQWGNVCPPDTWTWGGLSCDAGPTRPTSTLERYSEMDTL